jgi:hypothetical protein
MKEYRYAKKQLNAYLNINSDVLFFDIKNQSTNILGETKQYVIFKQYNSYTDKIDSINPIIETVLKGNIVRGCSENKGTFVFNNYDINKIGTILKNRLGRKRNINLLNSEIGIRNILR